MDEFKFQEMFPLAKDHTDYRRLTADHVSTVRWDGAEILQVAPEALTLLSRQAFTDVAHLYRPSHLKLLARIFADPESSANDRTVALELLKNAVIAAEMVFPMCQDTGTAIVIGKKGQQVWTGISDEEALTRGVFKAYTANPALLPECASVHVRGETHGAIFRPRLTFMPSEGTRTMFPFHRKGRRFRQQDVSLPGNQGSAEPETLVAFMAAKMKTLGTALPSVPSRFRGRRDFRGGQSQDG